MSEVAIRAEGLGKLYSIGTQERYLALRDVLTGAFRHPFGRLLAGARHSASGKSRESIWAVKDVSFEVNRGDVVGIVGRNGAGKSTLLKILSRVTEPTEGRATVWGRLGSLLEVGTGFHPELTGRENLFLSGAMLGMSKQETLGKLDAIVEFAEIERFLDTPVKFYSSGMYIRLAFAVAAHLEPDILLIDEVLAVGDAAFQNKCLRRLDTIGSVGATAVIVTHNLAIVKGLCHTAIWIDNGMIRDIGPPATVVDEYLATTSVQSDDDSASLERNRIRGGGYSGDVKVIGVTTLNDAQQPRRTFPEGSKLMVQLQIECSTAVRDLRLRVPLWTVDGVLLYDAVPKQQPANLEPGLYEALIELDVSVLLPGVYRADIILFSGVPQDRIHPAFEIEIAPDPKGDDDPYTLVYSAPGVHNARSELGIVRLNSRLHEFVPATEQIAERSLHSIV